jgi:hypothetical protein
LARCDPEDLSGEKAHNGAPASWMGAAEGSSPAKGNACIKGPANSDRVQKH